MYLFIIARVTMNRVVADGAPLRIAQFIRKDPSPIKLED
jgi:hypothetical protein